MGRYYNTNTGGDGKFGFAIQNSTDPGDFFGMEEEEQHYINYYINEDQLDNLVKKMDELYDLLQIPNEMRVYQIPKGKNNYTALDEVLKYSKKKHWKVYDKEDPSNEHRIPYHSDEHTEGVIADKEIILAECRLTLGLQILDDVQKEGYCQLEAEL